MMDDENDQDINSDGPAADEAEEVSLDEDFNEIVEKEDDPNASPDYAEIKDESEPALVMDEQEEQDEAETLA
jgi:hypothetical protein